MFGFKKKKKDEFNLDEFKVDKIEAANSTTAKEVNIREALAVAKQQLEIQYYNSNNTSAPVSSGSSWSSTAANVPWYYHNTPVPKKPVKEYLEARAIAFEHDGEYSYYTIEEDGKRLILEVRITEED